MCKSADYQESDFPPLQTPKFISRKPQRNNLIPNVIRAVASKHKGIKNTVVPAKEARDILSSNKSTRENKVPSRKCTDSNYQANIDNTLNRVSMNDQSKFLICSDSHGRDLAWYINKNQRTRTAVGFVRPGGRSSEILNHRNITNELKTKNDVLVIICGSNDISKNEADVAIDSMESTIKKTGNNKIILVDLPIRYDLPLWSSVNKLQRKTNIAIKELCSKYDNVSIVEVSKAMRQLHTRHGLHLNSKGKKWLAKQICDAVVEVHEEISTPISSSPVTIEEVLREAPTPSPLPSSTSPVITASTPQLFLETIANKMKET
ncbi:hypothetical protein J6590_045360 [Homalodisca vitripennis]|nr:hypothetical protein J6590_101250 [Homalodisca vitripennis]KAG8273228.1 hypothetical protein J6590_025665 [Homalodisca vitripennis]KAG8299619.1 hypothetical protein J6590_096386 [Homalodisca vitripennis]KAG8302916.1 hypothetical protein J6590_020670 [Homalodisca vitripennis]KAG8336395.1 hypothetical protein J6590_045360 [Homalodisca vitripennis]